MSRRDKILVGLLALFCLLVGGYTALGLITGDGNFMVGSGSSEPIDDNYEK